MDVLIVERDQMVAEVLADALADVGITADITADEDQALRGGWANLNSPISGFPA
jgi:DNA-binding response OmpR family regulator